MHALHIATLALLGLSAPLAAQDPARLLPTDTILFNGTDSLRAGSKAAKASAMQQIFSESEVKAFLNKPLSTLDHLLAEASKGSGLDVPPVTMSDLVYGTAEGPPIGRLFTALTHVDVQPGDGGPPTVDVGLVVGIEMLDAQDLGMLRGLWAMIPFPQEETTISGHQVFAKPTPDGAMSIHLAFLDNLAVLTLSRGALEGVIARFDGGSGPTLADSAEYRRLVELGGGHHAGGSITLLRPGPIAELAKTALALSLASQGQEDMVPKVSGIIDRIGMGAIVAIGSSSYRDAQGLVRGTSVSIADPTAGGFLARMAAEEQPISLDRLASLPGGAMGASAGSVPDLAAIYDLAMGIIEDIDAEAAGEARAAIERVMPESELRRTILDNIGGELWTFTLPNQGVMSVPATVTRVHAEDPALFIEGMSKLIAFIAQESGMPIGLKPEETDGVKTWTLDLSKTPAAMAIPGMSPGFGTDGNDVLFSLESIDLLRRAVQGTAGDGRLVELEEFTAFVDSLKKHGEIVGLSFTDNKEAFRAIYGQAAGAAQMFGASMKDLPVDLALLPTEGAISKHLRYSFSGAYRTGNGRETVSRSISQFELSDFVPLIVMGGAFVALSQAGGLEGIGMQEEADPRKQVLDDLGRIKAGLTIYKIMEGGYPDSLDAIVQPLEDYPNGYLGSLELPVDPWGNGYHYQLAGNKPRLWSAGPDGIDQAGGGDDILKER